MTKLFQKSVDVTKVNIKQIAYKHSGLGCGVYYSEFIANYMYISTHHLNQQMSDDERQPVS